MKKDNIKTFVDEIYTKLPMKINNYIGADNTSQNLIDVISLRSIPSPRLD